jgi:hypothetical protein
MNRRYGALVALMLLTAACDDDPAAPVGQPLPPLQTASWHVHRADGSALPALVAHRTVEHGLEQTFLDSAHFAVRADGRWEQALYVERLLGHVRLSSEVLHDVGSWAVTDSGYTFVSDVRGARYHFVAAPGDSVSFGLRAAELPGVVVATLRRPRPAAALPAAWHAASVDGRALPGVLYHFPSETLNGVPLSVHIIADSARMDILPNGMYSHRVWVSEWHGEPNGPPRERRLHYLHGDHGQWTRTGSELQFESFWLQNHRMNGTVGSDGTVRVQHGFTPGDAIVPFVYAR